MKKLKFTLRYITFSIFLTLPQTFCSKVWARPVTAYEAELVVTGWLLSDSKPLNTSIGRRVLKIESFTDNNQEPIYFIVYLEPFGFVIVPADDLVEPIIGFTESSIYDPSPDNPLSNLVNNDLQGRITTIRKNQKEQTKIGILALSNEQRKWNDFILRAETSKNKLFTLGLRSVSDIRVAPLLKSEWSQNDVCDSPCYNYYTPNNYPCGCVATAMSQIMLYYRYPNTGIGVHDFEIEIDGQSHTAYTIGGDSHGGRYSWANMELVPDCSITESQRQDIGALCYDTGISVNMAYSSDGSSVDILLVKDALTKIFKFNYAITGYNEGSDIGLGLHEMINPNLDAKVPVIIGIYGTNGHAAVVDGYGYNASTLYHHLNMGWAGIDDIWYYIPTVLDFNAVSACVYNIFPEGKGEIISGLVTDIAGKPINQATVTASNTRNVYNSTTDDNGIYALTQIPSRSKHSISVSKSGYIFTSQTVTTGTSRDLSKTSGNVWQIDFTGFIVGDFDGDNDVDALDFSILASTWLTKPSDDGWNPLCDISPLADDFVDMLDLAAFVENWLVGVK